MTREELLILLEKTNRLRFSNIENLIDLFKKDAFRGRSKALLAFIDGEKELANLLNEAIDDLVGKFLKGEMKEGKKYD